MLFRSNPAGAKPVAPVAGGSAGNRPENIPAPHGPLAAKNPVAFGGNVGKKKRADGLKSGSPEAIAADRERNAERMRLKRAVERAENPPPLPPAGAVVPDQTPPPGADQTFIVPSPLVPWSAADVKDLTDELIPAVEQECVQRLTSKAAKANLPAKLLKEIEIDARWKPVAKKGLQIGLPEVLAKWLNKFGVSADNKGEVALGLAVVVIAQQQISLERKLGVMIKEQSQNQPPKPAPEKS